jgi:hypothetical protein
MSQLEMTTTSILSLFQTDKAQRQTFIAGVVDSLESGQVDPLKVHVQIKCIEKIIEGLTSTDEKKNKDNLPFAKKYKSLVLEAAEKYGQKEFEFMNSKIKIGETGTKYDYSNCGDVELEAWSKQADELAEKIKARQEMLRTIPQKGMLITNEETGETYQVYPPAKSSTTNITLTLK